MLLRTLCCLSWALALAFPTPDRKPHGSGTGSGSGGTGGTGGTGGSGSWHHMGLHPGPSDPELARRCGEEGFDAITPDENGTMLFFQGDLVWKGFSGAAEPLNTSWPEVQGPIDAALRMHHQDRPDVHDNVFLFKGDQLWAYAEGRLRAGYPRPIGDEFKGVPVDLDAAVECHPKECGDGTLLFFKGTHVVTYDLKTQVAKQREWPALPKCSAAARWLGRYYCFQGASFWRFDPVTGAVPPNYPRDARNYFMRCPGRGHGHEAQKNATLQAVLDPCSGLPFRAFSSDDAGRIYAFREGHYFQVDKKSSRDGLHAWPLSHTWKDLQGEVDAAFSWDNKLHLIQGLQVTIYLADQGYRRVEGYPKPIQEELGVSGADAAFSCPNSQYVYFIQGDQLRRVDLNQSPRTSDAPHRLPHSQVDSALCSSGGIYLFQGADFHHYSDVAQLLSATAPSPAQKVAPAFFQCPSGPDGSPKRPPH